MQAGQVPQTLVDPITYEVFVDPVTAADGLTYERTSILDWFERCRHYGHPLTSPMTGAVIGDDTLRENLAVRQLIEELNRQVQGLRPQALQQTNTAGARSTVNNRPQAPGDVASLTILAQVFEAVEPLRDILGDLPWEPPQIVVLGNENSGKSSLLERIAMMPLFPIDRHICTRMVLKICLRRGEPLPPLLEVREMDSNEVVRSRRMAVDRAAGCIDEWMREEVKREHDGTLSGVCRSRLLVIHVQSSTVPNLDLVDLPGLVTASVQGEPENMGEQTLQLLQSYLDRHTQHSTFLVAVPANGAVNQSIAMNIVQQRNLQDRTIGVLTKADLLIYRTEDDDESEVQDRVQELIDKLEQKSPDCVLLQPHGYVATMNKPLRPNDQTGRPRDDLLRQAARELQYFESRGIGNNDRVGAAALVARLASMYNAYVVNTWLPGVLAAIQAEAARLRACDHRLGLPRAHKMDVIHHTELVAAAQAIFADVFSTSSLSTLCKRLFIEVLNEGNLFDTVATKKPIWELEAWLEAERGARVEAVSGLIARCAHLCRRHVPLLLAADESAFQFARFGHVLEQVDVQLEQALDIWRTEAHAAIVQMLREYHRNTCRPHLKVTHALENSEATVLCEIDYSTLNAAVCQLVMESICHCLLGLRWEDIDAGPDTPEIWLESCADERSAVLARLEQTTTILGQLGRLLFSDENAFCEEAESSGGELEQRLELTDIPTEAQTMPTVLYHLGCIREAIAEGNMLQVVWSARSVVDYLRESPSLARCELVGAQGGVELVHRALGMVCDTGGSNDALLALLECTRWLSAFGDTRDNRVDSNLDRFQEMGTVRHVVTALSGDQGAKIVASACLCLSYLVRNTEVATAAGEAGGCHAIARALELHGADAEVAKWACWAIVNLSAAKGNEMLLSDAGACEVVTRALELHETDAAIVKWTCSAIANLAVNDENDVQLGKVGACEAIVQALKLHVADAGITKWACWAISNLSAANSDNKMRLGVAGACEAVIHALKKNAADATAAKWACWTIANLAVHDENGVRLDNAGVCETIIQTLQLHLANAAVAERACRAIASLAANHNDNHKKMRLGAVGACEAVTRALENNTADATVAKWACWAIANLAVDDDNNVRLGNADACETVAQALRSHLADAAVAERACRAIASLAANNANKMWLGDAGACEAVANALTLHATDVDLAKSACWAIAYLSSTDSDNNCVNKLRLGGAGACEAINRALEFHAADAEVARQARWAIAILATNDTNRARLECIPNANDQGLKNGFGRFRLSKDV